MRVARRGTFCRDGFLRDILLSVSGELRDLLHEREQCGDLRLVRADRHCGTGADVHERPVSVRGAGRWLADRRWRRGAGESERCRQPSPASAWRLLTPIVGVVIAALLLGERPTPMSVLGGAVSIVGVAIANWRKKWESSSCLLLCYPLRIRALLSQWSLTPFPASYPPSWQQTCPRRKCPVISVRPSRSPAIAASAIHFRAGSFVGSTRESATANDRF